MQHVKKEASFKKIAIFAREYLQNNKYLACKILKFILL